jgi:LmbE family N-acetylglucosaminyl deacetylase
MFDSVRAGAIVVAHPDDETLWCGGLMVRFPRRWTVICCSIPRVDPIRACKFFEACEVLGAKPRLLPFTESPPNEPLGHLDALELNGFDCIVTHNEAGEYGHRHHRDVHAHVVARAAGRCVAIGYRTDARRDADPGAICTLRLSTPDYWHKRQALARYDHTSPSDGRAKCDALLDRYGSVFDLSVETYERVRG